MWLANLVTVTLPARFAAQAAAWPEIAEVQHDVPIGPAGGLSYDYFYGTDRRIAIRADRPISHGFTGATGNAAPLCQRE